jgi:hypothetical protein
VVLEEAVGGVEAGFAQPAQLGLDVGAPVVAHALQGTGPLGIVGSRRAR